MPGKTIVKTMFNLHKSTFFFTVSTPKETALGRCSIYNALFCSCDQYTSQPVLILL